MVTRTPTRLDFCDYSDDIYLTTNAISPQLSLPCNARQFDMPWAVSIHMHTVQIMPTNQPPAQL